MRSNTSPKQHDCRPICKEIHRKLALFEQALADSKKPAEAGADSDDPAAIAESTEETPEQSEDSVDEADADTEAEPAPN